MFFPDIEEQRTEIDNCVNNVACQVHSLVFAHLLTSFKMSAHSVMIVYDKFSLCSQMH